jgi:excisionase family DNA binding protein
VVRDLPPDPGPHEGLLTVRQVAARLGVSSALVYKLCERKELQRLRIGGTFRFQEAALQSFLTALDLAAKR